MKVADNKLTHPLEIADAREAAHRASELQREVEDAIKAASRDLAEAERRYRKALAEKIVTAHADDGIAWTTCADVARGDKAVADLRYARDVAEGVLDAMRQQAFRRGSDRRDLDTLLNWSMHRDLRTDAPPAEGSVRSIGAAA
jgi:hypothetical protein